MTIVVTGSTGKVGSHVLDRLTALSIPARGAGRRSRIPLDWEKPDTWAPAVQEATALFLVVPGGDDGYRSVAGLGERICEFIGVAEQAGVARIVLMTALGMQYAPSEVEQRAVELALQRSGLHSTIVRPNWFFQNATAGVLRDLAAAGDGVLRLPVGEARASFVDARDVAAVCVRALTDDLSGQELDVTGPAALTFAELATAASQLDGPLCSFESISAQRFRADAEDLGWDPDYTDVFCGLMAAIASGSAATVTDAVATVTGRPATTLAEFIADQQRAA
ncbi:NAD(P)H-binding protein [Nocardia amamiensis]|uniref:NAD(P)H-binding protein n=1 Tax=Nocardia amamiensis TaxID=404578 RepID=UPI000836E5FC|nr:NAD(P)H-binding protein [Nocardia amamiensis]